MGSNILRNWFVPKEGINRSVISADIQKYLGNDATVRPGKDKEIEGYWIKAYRNLTSEMINDLRTASTKWEQEQRSGRRGAYEESHTYRQAANSGTNGNGPYRASTNSPQLSGDVYLPSNGHVSHAAPRMPIAEMPSYEDPRRMYAAPPHSAAPVTSAYGDPSIYPTHQPRPVASGYGPPGDFYNGHPGYAHEAAPPPHVRGPPQYPPQYPTGHRDPRDDPRYAPEYQDPMRYTNYPPVSVASNGAPGPQTTSNYPPPRLQQFDSYGRPYPASTPMPDQSYARPSPSVDPSAYGRERPSAPPGSERGAPRRRIN
ncbi:hypothetical protein M436DRAFT_38741 [Aureobasidium namibiae CBS 147.97]|uniref:Transcription factor RfeG n=1 Tax=Aureobasidium namibiae CBS 147.97 TaxID=1043004 RepID=A0A074WU98_9PEZI